MRYAEDRAEITLAWDEVEGVIFERAKTDPGYAIAWALMRCADHIEDVADQLYRIADQLEIKNDD